MMGPKRVASISAHTVAEWLSSVNKPLLKEAPATRNPISPRPTMAKPTCTMLFVQPRVHIGAAHSPLANLPMTAATVRSATSLKRARSRASTGTWNPTEQAKKIFTNQLSNCEVLCSQALGKEGQALATMPAINAPNKYVECNASAPQLSARPKPIESKMAILTLFIQVTPAGTSVTVEATFAVCLTCSSEAPSGYPKIAGCTVVTLVGRASTSMQEVSDRLERDVGKCEMSRR
mmetsp:Transcript_54117/g.137472  ORF Transcript_54117/g.137472 Transcript_54117/m.137472 type:complete len:234 (+) Transcript_54117:282-983(+)